MQTKASEPVHAFFQDKEGHTVVWQQPNLPLIAWAVFKVLELIVPLAELKSSFGMLGSVCLLVWSVLELMQGASYFRRTLGAVVLASVLTGYFLR